MSKFFGKQINFEQTSSLPSVIGYDSNTKRLYYSTSSISNDTYGSLTRHWIFKTNSTIPSTGAWAWIDGDAEININVIDNDQTDLTNFFSYLIGTENNFLIQISSENNSDFFSIYKTTGIGSFSGGYNYVTFPLEIITKEGSLLSNAICSISFIPLFDKQTFNTSSFVTTSSFNNFTASYNTGSFSGSFTGSFNGTASWSNNTISASYALTASVAVSASYALSSSVAVSASYALTASRAVSSSMAISASYTNYAENANYANTAGTAGTLSNHATVDQINVGDTADVFIRPGELEESKYTTLNIYNYNNFT